jgi:tRNA A37 threonylcarbamoyladenosine synthetase subunit TsaC/SUA5/YrdC
MAQFFEIHPENPQLRLIKQAVEIINKGGVIVYPTDSAYALGCHIGDKNAMDTIRRIRRLDEKHDFTLMCSDGVYSIRKRKPLVYEFPIIKSRKCS